ncbi:hypothetical protein [Metamycoplasma hominis]|uniref:hypothetical protein n=1 Tax=Metamycoplasma hominis TaxID=2098 RepID=UPI00193A6A56|nr:hypothetical protein [Metamycoplasma hominis]
MTEQKQTKKTTTKKRSIASKKNSIELTQAVVKYITRKYGKSFNDNQIAAIYWGLERGLNVSLYAKPKYGVGQMLEIAFGLVDDLDVSIYASTKYDMKQMEQIRQGLVNKLDVSVYADSIYDWRQMKQMKESLLEERESKLLMSLKKFRQEKER